MNLKNRILCILTVALILTAIATGIVLIFLVKIHGDIAFTLAQESILNWLAGSMYLLAGLLVLGLLVILLKNKMVIPVAEHELMESEREVLTRQLHHSQKMEAVGRLAGSIAHDFNNLLTIIDGYISLIISDPKASENEQYAQEILEASRKASFITRKLLSFSHKEQLDPVLLDLNATLADAGKMLSRLIGEKVQVITRLSDTPMMVKADPVQLGQVMMNLSLNARDAMPNGGRIIVTTEVVDICDDKSNKPEHVPVGTYARISVRDTGVGISIEEIENIFEPFFTTKVSGEGTGLGLSIVYTIIREFGGFIDLTSQLGSGTTFMIYLPLMTKEDILAHGKVESSEVKAPKKDKPVHSDEKIILLVEDDPIIRNLVSKTLRIKKFTVLTADDGWDAVQLARRHEGPIDLLFTDVVMPGLNGAELAIAIRELYPDIKLLFMSGYSRQQVIDEGVPPAAPFLEKPFLPEKALEQVCDLLSD